MARLEGVDDTASTEPSPLRAAELAAQVRAHARDTARSQAQMLRRVAELAREIEAEARHHLLAGPRVPGQPSDDEVIRTAVVGEIQAVLGISEWSAGELFLLAARLTTDLPDTLDALESGRLDLTRAKVLEKETRDLPDDLARRVEALLPGAGGTPWEGPSPRAWRQRVDRAVIRADSDAARRRRQEAARQRLVRSWVCDDGSAELLVAASAEDVAMAEAVITDLAHAWPAARPDGGRLTMDQRRVDALMEVFRRIRDGRDLPALPVRRQREIGLVLHADTLFPVSSGEAGQPRDVLGDPGEIRGLGDAVTVDPVSAAEIARAELARGAALNVLLVGAAGALQRLVRLPRMPAGGWTKESVARAVRDALGDLPELTAQSYSPTVAISEHVRARHPRCGSYDCARGSRRCDLDHDRPWPRGPTSVTNLVSRCRRHHETKTRGLVQSRLDLGGSLTTAMLTGLVVTTCPEPLPGFGVGESYGPRCTEAQSSAPAAA